MNDPLEQLRDIHLPEPVGWWPLAWGWWLLIALLVMALAGLIGYLWRRRQRWRYRRQALQELDRLYAEFREHGDGARYLQDISVLLRRTALSAFPRQEVAGLQGPAWLQWLNTTLGEGRTDFSQGPGRVLLDGPYRLQPQVEADTLQRLVALWIKQHRRPAKEVRRA